MVVPQSERTKKWRLKNKKHIDEYNKLHYAENYKRQLERIYAKGTHKPMGENKTCPLYLGVHIAEDLIPYIFENVQKMPNNNIGYDFICQNGYKIDVKSATKQPIRGNYVFVFKINKNVIADFFLFIAFDSREKLNIKNMWLIKGNEMVGIYTKKQLNSLQTFSILKTKHSLDSYQKYELMERIIQLKVKEW